MRLVIDDKIPYIRGLAEQLGETVYRPGTEISPADVRDADALIIRTRTHCNEALLSGSRVRFIATATIGFDHLDTRYLQQAGISWANCPGCNARSVAQYIESALLALHEEGRLPDPRTLCVGIVGVGHVGSAVAEVLRELGCRLLLCDPPRAEREGADGFADLATLAEEADVITCHTPLTTTGPHATYHLIDAPFFAALRRRPLFINSGRGEVVNTPALLQALESGQVSEAVIDTWEDEPHISLPLLQRVVIGTPHIAGYSADGKANGTQMALNAVARFFGLPQTFRVSPPALTGVTPEADPVHRKLQLYDPRRDSQALKAHPEQFEYLRGHYPLRREHF